jgi:light-regulated signal transduction histidine kinase (bacteriophytochrome)
MMKIHRSEAVDDRWLSAVHPDDRERVGLGWREAMRLGRPYSGVGRCLHPDGQVVWWAIQTAPILDGENLLGFVAMVEDVTERTNAEEALKKHQDELEARVAERTNELQEANRLLAVELQRRTADQQEIGRLHDDLKLRAGELERANEQLRAFSYSVSHDLRAPLRAITGFSQILARRHADRLDDQGRHFLQNILDASARMHRLIDDLLAYAQLGRHGLKLQATPLAELLAPILSDLASRLEQVHAVVSVAPDLPTVHGDATLLGQVFTNLLVNAIAYRRKNVSLEVSVSWRATAQGVCVLVKDNGIGIPKEHQEKIFEVFQRLHADDDVPGSGVGLATVKKAVALQGGRVWVESLPGEGSTFFVELRVDRPAAAANN